MRIRIDDDYEAEILYDAEGDHFDGFIRSGPGLREGDVVHFMGRSIDELRREARISLNVHRGTEKAERSEGE